MVDYLEPLLPVISSAPGMNQAELVQACEDALLRAVVLDDVLQGKRNEDDFNDLLREDRLDPDTYWRNAETAVDLFIDSGVIPDSLEFLDSGLVVPRNRYP